MNTKIRIKKALVEAKFMARPEDMDKIQSKLKDNDIVKLVDETEVNEDENERAGRSIEYGVPEPELGDADYEEIHKQMNEEGEETTNVDSDINYDKLRADVVKLMDKLNLGQFDNVFKRIDKPQEQAEVIAAFAERIGVPRNKLTFVISSLKDMVENEKPIITKEKLEEFIKNQRII